MFLVDHAEVVLHLAESAKAAIEQPEGAVPDLLIGEKSIGVVGKISDLRR